MRSDEDACLLFRVSETLLLGTLLEGAALIKGPLALTLTTIVLVVIPAVPAATTVMPAAPATTLIGVALRPKGDRLTDEETGARLQIHVGQILHHRVRNLAGEVSEGVA